MAQPPGAHHGDPLHLLGAQVCGRGRSSAWRRCCWSWLAARGAARRAKTRSPPSRQM